MKEITVTLSLEDFNNLNKIKENYDKKLCKKSETIMDYNYYDPKIDRVVHYACVDDEIPELITEIKDLRERLEDAKDKIGQLEYGLEK